MTLMSVPIDSITEGHLRSLIEDQVIELRLIEYKRELPGRSDRDKKEFLADVCSFANTAGGDLMYGIVESGGTPQHLVGIAADNVDARRSADWTARYATASDLEFREYNTSRCDLRTASMPSCSAYRVALPGPT
jgi:hypothetical protein